MMQTPDASPSPAAVIAPAGVPVTNASPTAVRVTPTQRLIALGSDIKLSHSVFALPWALLATFMASPAGRPRVGQVLLIVICMVLARTCAMCANRLLDARLDALNPRTARRAIPSGRLSKAFVAATIGVCVVGFYAAAAMFGVLYHNWIPVIAAGPVLAAICAYPLLKRFSNLCHYYLGACLAAAPVCAWVAIGGRFDVEPFLMAGAVLLWTAGFDILYACQDYESDLQTGIHSVPARVGIPKALWIARFSHLACVGFLIALGLVSPMLGTVYFIAVAIVGVLMTVEHLLVTPTDLSKLNLAFFTLNGIISLLVGACGIGDVLLHAARR
ncbi:MAG: UbiA-like polyprenyltransferase [Tepidisphaeraceae bacterium]